MANFSTDQIATIAQQFHDLSAMVEQFRFDQISSGKPLEDPQIVQLLGLQFGLSKISSSVFIEAAELTLSDADGAARQIVSATQSANSALGELKSIDKVINIASAAAVLGTAVMTGDLSQIGNAAKGVFAALETDHGMASVGG